MNFILEYNDPNWEEKSQNLKDHWIDYIKSIIEDVTIDHSIKKAPVLRPGQNVLVLGSDRETPGLYYSAKLTKYTIKDKIILTFYTVDEKESSHFNNEFLKIKGEISELIIKRLESMGYKIDSKLFNKSNETNLFYYKLVTHAYVINISLS